MIVDPQNFPWKDNRWQDLFSFLKGKGFDVYSPATKVGECTSPYLVVTYSGTSEWFVGDKGVGGVDRDVYSIIVYVPKKRYSELETLVFRVKEAMAELKPLFIYEGSIDTVFYDDDVKAHMTSIDYRNYKQRF